MLEIIVAVNKKYGIGFDGTIPWKCPGDLTNFKKITQNSTIIVGRRTCESLPKLVNRKIICLSKTIDGDRTWNNDVNTIGSLDEIDSIISSKDKYFVAGGAHIYHMFAKYKLPIHISFIKDDSECDTFFKREWLNGYVIHERVEYDEFTYTYMKWDGDSSEQQYLDIMRRILDNGSLRSTRNGNVLSIFNANMIFDLRDGFPLITTKKMFLRGIIEELLFFLRGDTDTTILSGKNVNIWKGNTTKEFLQAMKLPYAENVMGPMYGYQWRSFNRPYKITTTGIPTQDRTGDEIDQIKDVVNLIRTDPTSRRILLTTYNPIQAHEGVLYPCHSIIIQFYVDGDFLDMFCYNRSQDLFLGTPYNIASSSLLLMIIAKICNKIPRKFHLSMGDVHIYESHINVSKQQIERLPYKKPNIKINRDIADVDELCDLVFEDFELSNYNSDSKLFAEMVT